MDNESGRSKIFFFFDGSKCDAKGKYFDSIVLVVVVMVFLFFFFFFLFPRKNEFLRYPSGVVCSSCII